MAELKVESVLREEAMAIHGGRIAEVCGEDFPGKSGKAFNHCLNALDSAALCLSGGGIRSASFALGVVQALASHPRPVKDSGEVDTETAVERAENALLARFHYLSTVSGGGYIGSWLSTWLARSAMKGDNAWPAVWAALLARRSDANDEPQQMSWLRRYSNFLTPKLGVTSTDSWAAIALILRNLLLNWLIILPLVCALLLVLKLAAVVIVWFARLDPQSRADDVFFFILVGLGAVALIASLRFTTHHRPTSGHGGALDQRGFLLGGLLPATVAALMFTAAAALPFAQAMMTDALVESGLALARVYLVLMGAGLVLYAVGWFAARRMTSGRDYWGDLTAWSTAGLAFGAMMAFGLWLFAKAYSGPGFWIFEPSEILLVVFGLPWMILSQLVAEMLFVGLTSGQADSDSDREWLGRAAGCALLLVLGWLVSMFFVFLGSRLMHEVVDAYWPWLTGAGAASGGLTAWLGKSGLSPAKGEAKTASGLSANVVLAMAGPAFVIILFVLLSAGLDKLLLGGSLLDHDLFASRVAQGEWPSLAAAAWMIAALVIVLVLGLLASKYVNINRFSLHALYRNRLIRAFLGASNGARTPNAFTGFDEADNIRMYDLWPAEAGPDGWPTVGRANWRPFHVVNIALNAVATSNLAWQERKAMPFTVSALHAG